MTLSTYILGFALGQLIYGRWQTASGVSRWFLAVRWCLPRRGGVCVGTNHRSADCDAFLHGLAAAAASVVINALMRDITLKKSSRG